jgi:dTDP-4-dehydrorhamnose 3,5-epimerase
MINQARRSPQTVTAEWKPVNQRLFPGVQLREIKNLLIRSGVLTECFRPEWIEPSFVPAHAVYMTLMPGGISSWHCHRRQRDVIVGVRGHMRIGLYDDREDSPDYKAFSLLNFGVARPAVLHVPPLVWHAIKNPTGEEAAYLVLNDEPFDYEAPDDWTLPPGSQEIPFSLD